MELKIGGTTSSARTAEKPFRRPERPAKKCIECGRPMKELRGSTPEGVEYTYLKCTGCGKELATTGQLHEVAQKSRALKTYSAKITQWGQSLGMRIPKDLASAHSLTNNEEVTIIPEEFGFRVVPIPRK